MVEAAFTLFHEKGIHATSVDEVLERSRTGKSQFSHYFKTKDGLVHAVLQYLDGLIRSGTVPATQPLQSWQDLEDWFRAFLKWQKTVNFALSCPVATIGSDLTEDQKLLRQKMQAVFDYRRDMLTLFFQQEQSRSTMRKDVRPAALADFCYTVVQGGLLMAKLERRNKPFKNAVDNALAYLRSLRIPEKPRTKAKK